MTRRKQKQFVKDLTGLIRDYLVLLIDSKRIPAEWDGHELRELLYERAKQSRSSLFQIKGNQRKREYDNTVLINNL